MHSCHVKLHELVISMSSGWGKVHQTMPPHAWHRAEKTDAARRMLLDTVNAFALDYLPLLQRIMVKATTAAIAHDTPMGQEDANAASTGKASVELVEPEPAARAAKQ
jgi:hypothetical protein